MQGVSILSTDPPAVGLVVADQRREAALNRLTEMLDQGTCTPLLGAGASSESIPVGERLAAAWAQRYNYPLNDSTNLPRVAQYVLSSGLVNDVDELKNRFVSDFLHAAPPPDFNDGHQIHSILASFKLPIFVTTNFDDYMCQALWKLDKRPIVGISPWYPESNARKLGRPVLYDWSPPTASNLAPLQLKSHGPFQPDNLRPLVYHLHGQQAKPTSLVLTENDFIEYLMRLSADLGRSKSLGQGRDEQSIVPAVVREALGDQSVLFVGYSLRDVSFQVLFKTLTRDIEPGYRRQGISIQLAPPLVREATCTCKCCNHSGSSTDDDSSRPIINYAAVKYLDSYFAEQKITVFWGTTRDFAEELFRRRRGTVK